MKTCVFSNNADFDTRGYLWGNVTSQEALKHLYESTTSVYIATP